MPIRRGYLSPPGSSGDAEKFTDFNLTHPEMNLETEDFLGNYNEAVFIKIALLGKRMGSQAYDRFGNKQSRNNKNEPIYPVFVSKDQSGNAASEEKG